MSRPLQSFAAKLILPGRKINDVVDATAARFGGTTPK
jgi:hypothetical protein